MQCRSHDPSRQAQADAQRNTAQSARRGEVRQNVLAVCDQSIDETSKT